MRAVKTCAEVGSDKSLMLKSLPFAPGSRVEVIVFPRTDDEDVFPTMDRIVKKKGIKPLTMKQVEKIVHDNRGISLLNLRIDSEPVVNQYPVGCIRPPAVMHQPFERS